MKNDITCDVLTVVFANEGQLLHFKIILEFNHKTMKLTMRNIEKEKM